MALINVKKDIISTTDVGLVRKINEDSCAIVETPNGVICVVCDGMGGHAAGNKASLIAVNSIIQFFSKETYTNIPKALKDALDFANMQIIGATTEYLELKGMGTTACIMLLQKKKVWIAHVGDSRIYLYVSKDKCLHRLTKDHSYVQGLVDQGVIYEEEAENHPDKNRILKALGIKEDLSPDITEKPILPVKGDIFLICTDGLSGMVTDNQMQIILSMKNSLQEKETALMSAAKAAGGLDNITFQLVQISHSPYRKSIFKDINTELPKTVNKQNPLKSALLFIIILLSVGLFINRKGEPMQDETPIMSKDSIIINNQTDSILENDTFQIVSIDRKTDSII